MTKHDEFKCVRLGRTMTAGKCLRLQEEAEGFYGKDKAARCGSCPCEQGLEIRREIEMAQNKRRECRNCKRVMVIAQDGLCGGCWCRTKGLTGAAYDEALAKAKADFGGVPEGERAPQRKFYRGPQVKPQAADPGAPAEAGGLLTEEDFSELLNEESAKHRSLTKKPQEGADLNPVQGENPTTSLPSYDLRLPIFCERVGDPSRKRFPIIIVPFEDGDGRVYDALLKLGRKYRRDPHQQLLWLLEKELLNERMLPDDKITAPGEKAGCDGLRMFIPKEPLPEFPAAFTGTDPKKVEQYGS